MTHHHHDIGPHPTPAISPSLLRLSVVQRLGLAAILIGLIWLVVFWAIH
jgi:hypothetical protein